MMHYRGYIFKTQLVILSGSGTSSNPYLLYSEDDLRAMKNDVTAYYALKNDITLYAKWVKAAGIVPQIKESQSYNFESTTETISLFATNATNIYSRILSYDFLPRRFS